MTYSYIGVILCMLHLPMISDICSIIREIYAPYEQGTNVSSCHYAMPQCYVQMCHSVHPLLSAGEGSTSYQIFKKGGLDRTSIFRGGCWEGDFGRGARATFFRGVQFLDKKWTKIWNEYKTKKKKYIGLNKNVLLCYN